MRNFLIAAGVASLLGASALASSPAQASWAENAQSGNPVYTGTQQSQWRAERGRRHFSDHAGRGWHGGPVHYGWSHRGYDAYGRYDGGYFR